MKRKRPASRSRAKSLPAPAGKGTPRRLNLSGSPAMKCRKMLQAINDYVDGTLDPAICEGFESHLAGCNPCQIVVDNVRQTITLYKAGKPYPMPGCCSKRLHRMMREQWKGRFGRV